MSNITYHLLPKSCTVSFEGKNDLGDKVKLLVTISSEDDRYPDIMAAIQDGHINRLPKIVQREKSKTSSFMDDLFGEGWEYDNG